MRTVGTSFADYPDGFPLGQWISVQRATCTDPERRKKLENISGWLWNVADEAWDRGFELTKKYGCVTRNFITPCGHKLGRWQDNQRQKRPSLERQKKLESLPNWRWQRHELVWQEYFELTQKYGMVSRSFVAPNGMRLGEWQKNQRKKCKDLERRKLLENIPGWYWYDCNKNKK